jgi:hypothetical protein
MEIEPGSELTLEFDHTGNVVKVNLRRGCARLRTNDNVNGEIATPDGKTTKSDSKRRAAVCYLAAGAASDGGGLGTGAWTAIILGGAGAIITAIILTRDDEDPIVSPSR